MTMVAPPQDPKTLVGECTCLEGSNLISSALEHLLQEALLFTFAK